MSTSDLKALITRLRKTTPARRLEVVRENETALNALSASAFESTRYAASLRRMLDQVGTLLARATPPEASRERPIHGDPGTSDAPQARSTRRPQPDTPREPNGTCYECRSQIIGKRKGAKYCSNRCKSSSANARRPRAEERLEALERADGCCSECGTVLAERYFVRDPGTVLCTSCHVRDGEQPPGDSPVRAGTHYNGYYHVSIEETADAGQDALDRLELEMYEAEQRAA